MTADPTLVYSDGACSGNPGPGGWAWAAPGGRFASGAERRTTNQRMEVTAAFEAVRSNEGRLEVVSDSTYVVNCFRDRWHEGWVARGWLNSQRKPVANRDLWEPFVALVLARRDVTFRWVKGHDVDPMNDLVDRLAVEAALSQEGRTGDHVDLHAGAPPLIRRDRPVEGHVVLVTGHRPPSLGGWGPNAVADRVRARIAEILVAKRELAPDLTVMTGLQLGAEQLGAEAAIESGVPFVAIVPFPEPDREWPPEARRRYADLLAAAASIVQLERKVPATKQQVAGSLARRDAWLARHADEAIVVWDGEDAALGKFVRSLEEHIGDDVWIEAPGA